MDQAQRRQIREPAGLAARLAPFAYAILAALVSVTATEALAQGWKSGRVRDLTFDVPAEWHFVFDPREQAGGYTPDARTVNDATFGVMVVPGRFAELIPAEAIIRKMAIDVGGRTATEYEVRMPAEAGIEGRMIDIEGEGIDGRPIGIALVGPTANRDAWAPIFDRVLTTARFAPDVFIVPEIDGAWYVGGREDQAARAVGQSLDSYFSVDPNINVVDDERLEVVRLGPLELRIVAGAPQVDGRIDIAGSRIDWDDGSFWTRTPETAVAEAPEEPISPVGEPKPFELGLLATRVPDGWTISISSRDPLQSAYAIDPAHQGLAGAATLTVAADEAEAAFASYLEQANAVLLQGGRRIQSRAPQDPWTMSARYEGVMVWGADGAQPTMLEARAAPIAAGLVMLFVAWPSYATQAAVDEAWEILATATLAAGAGASQAEAQEGAVLFDGTLSDRWRELSVAGGDFSRFASTGDGLLAIDVPAGNAWGKTGIRSAEKVVKTVGADGRPATAHLRFAFDPARTTSYVLALGPNDQMEDWGNHDFRFGWFRSADGSTGSAVIWIRNAEVWRKTTIADAPAAVDLNLDPDGIMVVTLPDGSRMEASIPTPVPVEGYYLYALAHAVTADAPTRMALKSIELTHQEPAAVAGPLPYPDERPSIVLFDGTLGKSWVRNAVGGGDFARDAVLGDGTLAVDVAADHGWSKVGILSDGPVVWLDQFGGDAESRATFTFDPERTTGFILALTSPHWGHVGGNDPSSPNSLFLWHQEADATAAKAEYHINPHAAGDFWSADLPADPPSTVAFVLRAGSVAVEIDGEEIARRNWVIPAEGTGLSVYAYSDAAGPNLPARMTLKEIRLDRTFAQARVETPAAGVEPLPETVLFEGVANEMWEPAALAGGDYEAFANIEDGWLVVDVPEGHGWAKTGLLSAEPVASLDGRVEITPTRFVFTFDPKRTDGVRIAVAPDKNAEMWPNHDAWVTFIRDRETGTAIIGLHNSAYRDWSRPIDGDWMNRWDGRLFVEFGNGWTAVCLAEGSCIRGPIDIASGGGRHMTVLAHAEHQGGPARMALGRITRGLVTPPGMSEIDRWMLVDDDAFDPDAFADALVAAE